MLFNVFLFLFILLAPSNLTIIISASNNELRFLQDDQQNQYYYPHDGSYRSVCDYPYQVKRTTDCVLTFTEKAAIETQKTANTLRTTTDIANVITWISGIITLNDPAPFCFISLLELIQSSKYIDVKYPPKTLQVFLLYNKGQFELLTMPEHAKEAFTRRDLPKKFDESGIHSNFLVNFWQQTLSILIIGFCILLISTTKPFIKKYRIVFHFLSAIHDSIKWKYVLMLFLTYFGDIILFSSFEFRTNDLDSFLFCLSLIICVLMNVLACGILFMIGRVIYNFKYYLEGKYDPTDVQDFENYKAKWTAYRVLYEKFKDKSIAAYIFIPLFIIRLCLSNIIIGYLFDYPMVQTSLIILLNLGVLVYLVKFKPMKDRTEMTQYIVQEILMLALSFCVFLLALLDATGIGAYNFRNALDGIMTSCHLTFNILGTVCLGLKFLSGLNKLFISAKRILRKGKTEASEISALNLQNINVKISKIQEPSLFVNNTGISRLPVKTEFENNTITKSKQDALKETELSHFNDNSGQIDDNSSFEQFLSPSKATPKFLPYSGRPISRSSQNDINANPHFSLESYHNDENSKVRGEPSKLDLSVSFNIENSLDQSQNSIIQRERPKLNLKNSDFQKKAFKGYLMAYKPKIPDNNQ